MPHSQPPPSRSKLRGIEPKEIKKLQRHRAFRRFTVAQVPAAVRIAPLDDLIRNHNSRARKPMELIRSQISGCGSINPDRRTGIPTSDDKGPVFNPDGARKHHLRITIDERGGRPAFVVSTQRDAGNKVIPIIIRLIIVRKGVLPIATLVELAAATNRNRSR